MTGIQNISLKTHFVEGWIVNWWAFEVIGSGRLSLHEWKSNDEIIIWWHYRKHEEDDRSKCKGGDHGLWCWKLYLVPKSFLSVCLMAALKWTPILSYVLSHPLLSCLKPKSKEDIWSWTNTSETMSPNEPFLIWDAFLAYFDTVMESWGIHLPLFSYWKPLFLKTLKLSISTKAATGIATTATSCVFHQSISFRYLYLLIRRVKNKFLENKTVYTL